MRRLLTLVLTLCLLGSLTACGHQEAPPEEKPPAPEPSAPEVPADPDGDYTVYGCGGIEIALPTEYLDRLIVDMDFPDAQDSWKPLMSVYEKASVEAAEAEWGSGEGFGFLFGFLAMDRAVYEQLLCEAPSGIEVIAAAGERYYAYTFPTDVQFYRPGGEFDMESEDWKSWEILSEIGPAVRADMVERNGLTPYTSEVLFARSFTWEGNHAYLRFRHPGEYGEDAYVLALSQPVRQGEGGIWCVDRWMYEDANPMVYFPDSGLPAADYYAQLQAECDAGEHPELLTPAGAAAVFVRDCFGTEPAEETLRPLSVEEEARAAANLRLRGIVAEVCAGENVDGLELLECLGRAGEDNVASLDLGAFGLEDGWWSALFTALENAAAGEDQQTRDRDMMAFYLAIRNGPSQWHEAVAGLVEKQRQTDGTAFAAALESFSPEEQTALKAVLET